MYKRFYPVYLVLAILGMVIVLSIDFGVIIGIPVGLFSGVLYHIAMGPDRQKDGAILEEDSGDAGDGDNYTDKPPIPPKKPEPPKEELDI